mgnify:CR=1 FL=1
MIKIYLKGPLLTQSGYGHHARTVYRALRTREDLFDIYVQPIAWGKTSWEWRDTEERRALDECLNKTIQYVNSGGKFDVSIQVTIPNEWEQLAPINIGVTAGIESDRISSNWMQKSNMMTKIVTISKHAMSSFVNTVYDAVDNQTGEQLKYSLQTPIDYVPYPVLRAEPTGIDLDLSTDFNFLAVAQMGPRKNLGATIEAFVDAFGDNPDVGLIIKTNIGKNSLLDRLNSTATLRSAIEKHNGRKCKIYLLHGSMSEEEMASLYTHEKVKCIVSTTHGEGYGLPLFEAAYYGLPIIATDWSGHVDFLYKKTKQKNGKIKSKHMFSRVSYKLDNIPEKVVWEDVLIKESRWAYPDISSVKNNMIEVHGDLGRFEKRAKELQTWVCKNYEKEKIYKQLIESFNLGVQLEPPDYIFVSDMFAEQYVGGAELSLQAIIDATPENKNIAKINSAGLTKSVIDSNKNATWIFGNIAHMQDDVIKHVATSGVNYHFIEFDYKFCEYRNPELYKFLEDEECDYDSTEKANLIVDFINSSQKTHFMSEEQKDIYVKNFPKLDAKKLFVLSSVFDDEFFNNIESLQGSKKNDKWLVFGSRSWVKGTAQSEKWCQENNLEYEVINDLPYKDMLQKLATSKGICFKPTGLDTCPRYVIEAKLLGCELELNDNVQHVQEGWFSTADTQKTLNYLKNRKEVFWEQVSSCA